MLILAANGNQVLFVENTGVRCPTLRDLPRLRQRVRNWSRGTKGFKPAAARAPQTVDEFPIQARLMATLVPSRSVRTWPSQRHRQLVAPSRC